MDIVSFILILLGYLSFRQSDPIIVSQPLPTPTIAVMRFTGTASYYSESGCLGCSSDLTMANGERLDDTKLTIAMDPQTVRRYRLLNQVVRVKNVETNDVTTARVTDTGGFAVYNRIADLSVAVKRAIRCGDLCEVEVTVE